MEKVAYSYLRFSDPTQRWGDSERRQMEGGAALAKELHAVMADNGFYADHGVSAFRGRNSAVGALARFREKVAEGRIAPGSILIVENLDRLSREELFAALDQFMAILKAGVWIATVTPKRVYTKESLNNLPSLLEVALEMSRAHGESAVKGDRVRQAWDRRLRDAAEKKRPITALVPTWIEVKDGAFRLIPARAATVRQIFTLACEGMGAELIVRWLAARADRHPPWGQCGRWTESYVRKILHNTAAMGTMVPHAVGPEGKRVPRGGQIEDYFPAAVSPAEYARARAAIGRRRRGGGRRGNGDSNLFTGLVHNAATGGPMVLKGGPKRGKPYPVLADYRPRRGGPADVGHAIPYPLFEEVMLIYLKGLDLSELGGDRHGSAGQVAELQEAEALAANLDAKAAALDAELADPKQPASVVPRLTAALRTVVADSEAAAERLRQLREQGGTPPAEALGGVQDVLGLLLKAKPADRARYRSRLKARIRDLLEGVWVYVDWFSHLRKVAHVQVWYKTGECTEFAILCGHPHGPKPPRCFEGVDFRKGPPAPRQ